MGNKTEWHPGIVKESSKVREDLLPSELGLGPDRRNVFQCRPLSLGWTLHHVRIFPDPKWWG